MNRKTHRLALWFFAFLLPCLSPAYETSLFDIELHSSYTKTVGLLKDMFGPPFRISQSNGENFQAFTVSKERHVLVVRGSRDLSEVISVQISGDKPIPNLNFLGQLNLGMLDSDIDRLSGLPSMTRPDPAGSQMHIFPHSNFSIETQSGKIKSISIFVMGSEKMSPDLLKGYCRLRQALWKEENSYFSQAEIEIAGHKKIGVALLDTGWEDVSFTQDFCKKIGCRISNIKTRETSGGTARLGAEAIKQQNFYADVPPNKNPPSDIIIGTGFLFAHPTILNLRHNYICFPKGSMSQIASQLGLKKTPAQIRNTGAWIPVKFGERKTANLLVDTGSTEASLLPEFIRALKLKKLGTTERPWGGVSYKVGVYKGPVMLDINGSKRSVEKVLEAPRADIQKVGTQFLMDRIWGFDSTDGAVYFEP